MSSVDPTWPAPSSPVPPDGPTTRRRRRLLLGALAALLLLGLVLGVVGLDRRAGASGAGGSRGLGDPYFPRAGNSGYDVHRYSIALDWEPTRPSLTATTTIRARALQQLSWFYLDLALEVHAVRVDGAAADFAKDGFSDVRVQPATPIPAGADFTVEVDYSGRPGELSQDGVQPWRNKGQEWTAVGEPEVSAWWFPANDHPSDPALMEVSVRVPAGMEAISVGRLKSRDRASEAGFDTWHWVAAEPMATYLNFVSIGQYLLEEGTADGRPYVYAVSEQLTERQRRTALERLRTTPATVRVLESMFGPYPFRDLGGVVPAHQLGFGALENQTRPVYDMAPLEDAAFAPQLITHELAHMWFGNNVTLRTWDDIVNSEGWASWAQWGYDERTGGRSAAEAFEDTFQRAARRPGFWDVDLSDPGPDHLFDTVYTRGPMALQALRTVIGDEAFFALARDWASTPGTRSFEDWKSRAQQTTETDLGPFFEAWYETPRVPDRTPANGFP